VFERFEVVEIEATDGSALGIEVDVTDLMDTKASTLDPALLQLVVEMNLFGTVY
jgi:hypothetical protein